MNLPSSLNQTKEHINPNNKGNFDISNKIKTIDSLNGKQKGAPTKLEQSEIINQDNKNNLKVSIGEKIKNFLKFKNSTKIKNGSELQVNNQTNASSSQKLELLTEEITGVKIPRKILFILIFVIIGSLILVFGASFVFSIIENSYQIKVQSLENKIAEMREETKEDLETKESKVKNIAAQLEAINTIIKNRVQWNTILNNLETYTLPSIYYEGLNLDNSGKYTFSAKAKSFKDIINQVEIYKSASDFIKNVEVSNFKIVSIKKDEQKKETIETEPVGLENKDEQKEEQYIKFNIYLEFAPELLFST